MKSEQAGAHEREEGLGREKNKWHLFETCF